MADRDVTQPAESMRMTSARGASEYTFRPVRMRLLLSVSIIAMSLVCVGPVCWPYAINLGRALKKCN